MLPFWSGVLGLALGLGALWAYRRAVWGLARGLELLKANPRHRLPVKGPKELRALAQGANRLAELLEAKEEALEAQAHRTQRLLEGERRFLKDLLGRLPQGVVALNRRGRVVLYNPQAQRLLPQLSLGQPPPLDPALMDQALRDPQTVLRWEGLAVQVLPLPEGAMLLLEPLGAHPAQGPRLRALVESLAQGLEDILGLAPGISLEGEGRLALDPAPLLRALPDLARALEGAEGVYLRGQAWQGLVWLEILPVAQEPKGFLAGVQAAGGVAWREGERLVLLFPRLEAPREGPKVEERPPSYDLRLLKPPEGPLRARPLRGLLYTALDLETTGLDPKRDRIIAIGAVRLLGDRLLKEEVFEALVDPRRPIPPESTRVHGLRTEDLEGKPPIGEVLPRFHRFQEETVLLAHNGAFDLAFLQEEGRRLGLEFPDFLLDTLLLGQFLFPEGPLGLEALCRRLGVPVLGRHTALGDALMAAEVFRRLLPLLEDRGVLTLGQALEAMARTPLARLRY